MISVAHDVKKGRTPIFVVMAIAILVTVVVGFAPTFYLRSAFHPDNGLPTVLRVHGFALSACIVPFLVQTVLIVRGSNVLHRRLG